MNDNKEKRELDTQEVKDLIADEDTSAYAILHNYDKNIERRFNRLNITMIKLLEDVRLKFPDANYYTASGGFNLMLGDCHTDDHSNGELLALLGTAKVGDGDF